MRTVYLFVLTTILLIACSDDDSQSGGNIEDEIVGTWILERIEVEGPDCQLLFGPNIPTEYLADEKGCARPTEIQGNSRRCINVVFNEDGTGTFLWSEISSGGEDAPITYSIENDQVEYCFEQFTCSGEYELINGKLQAKVELHFEQTCRAVYILRKR